MSKLHYIHRAPKKVEPGKTYPAVLLIHGYGSNEQDLFGFQQAIDPEAFVFSLQAPIPLPWGGYAWFNINFEGIDKIYSQDEIKEAGNAILQFIEHIKSEYPVDEEQLHVVGFSQGAMLSYMTALTHPEKVSSMLAMSGFFIEKAVEKLAPVDEIKSVRMMVTHGSQDDIVPVDLDRKTVKMLEEKGLEILYKEYPMPHGINEQCLQDTMSWLNQSIAEERKVNN